MRATRDHPAGVRWPDPGGSTGDFYRAGHFAAASPSRFSPPSRPTPTRGPGLLSWVRRVLAGAVVIAVLVVGATAARVYQVSQVDNPGTAEAIVVLGAAQYNGQPSGVFSARLRHAHDLYSQSVAPRIITVGGRAPGDTFSEGGAGRDYLMGEGVPGESVLAIEEGADTLRSLVLVSQVMAERGWRSVVIVTDPWHSLRSATMAADLGLAVAVSPSKGAGGESEAASGIVRETGALLYYRLTGASASFSDPLRR